MSAKEEMVNDIYDVPSKDTKVNPGHYDGDACMRFIADKLSASTFCLGTAIKYVWRAGRKEGESRETDLKKARWYLEWALTQYAGSADFYLKKMLALVDAMESGVVTDARPILELMDIRGGR